MALLAACNIHKSARARPHSELAAKRSAFRMVRLLTHPTPNPNSLKITTDAGPFIETGMESFSSPEEAAGSPLGRRLFSLPGVANVFILPAFLTISKQPAADWDILLPKIEGILHSHFETGQAAE